MPERAVAAFAYHDVTDDPPDSGFRGPGALPFKLGWSAFRQHLDAMAGAPRKPLLIRSRRSASHVAVDVRDQGTGLVDPEKIFEPFVSTKETGMGMGLAICRSTIEAHGGGIWVVPNEGPGVTFSFSLPIETSDAT